MKGITRFRALSGGLAAVLCIGFVYLRAGAEAPHPPVITEALVDAENATLTINGACFRAGIPRVFLGNRQLPVRWATEASAAAWLPELRPGTYRLSARWPDGARADFHLTIGNAVDPAEPEGARGSEGPGALPGLAPAGAGVDCGANPGGTTRYGTDALENLSTGGGNSAFGTDALKNLATGGGNTAVGAAALDGLTTGGANTAVGRGAMKIHREGETTTGTRNSAFGHEALAGLGTGSRNVAVGFRALSHGDHDAVGDENTGVGVWALNRTTGARSVAVGFQALRRSTGSDNIAIGNFAGFRNPAGSNNVYLGHQGVARESGIIRIGTTGTHTHTWLAGRVITDGPFIGLAVDVSGDVSTTSGDVRAGSVSLKDLATRVKALEDAAPSASAD